MRSDIYTARYSALSIVRYYATLVVNKSYRESLESRWSETLVTACVYATVGRLGFRLMTLSDHSLFPPQRWRGFFVSWHLSALLTNVSPTRNSLRRVAILFIPSLSRQLLLSPLEATAGLRCCSRTNVNLRYLWPEEFAILRAYWAKQLFRLGI